MSGQDLILKRAIRQHGHVDQIGMAIEECAELIVACRKFLRDPEGTTASIKALVDEVADVQIMCRQLCLIFGPDLVEERVEFKLTRLAERLEKLRKEKKEATDAHN